MTLKIRPLSENFGAEILDVDLGHDLNDSIFGQILDAWRKFSVLLLRNQATGDEHLLRFAKKFGALDPAPPLDSAQCAPKNFPEITVVSNVIEQGAAIGGLGHGELAWHSDMTFAPNPPVGCILHAWEAPAGSGKTHFASLRNALAGLPEAERARLKILRAAHDEKITSAGTLRHGVGDRAPKTHPLIMRHPSWGDEVLLLGRRRNGRVANLPEAESEALLDALWAWATRPENAFAHDWRPGDVVIWDNLHVLHRRDAFDGAARRVLHRAQIAALHPEFRAA